MKFPGVISLRNALPIWAMPKGTFWRVACWTLRKLTDALRRLGAQIDHGGRVLDGTHEGLEHQVELSRLGELAVGVLAGLLGRLPRAGGVSELVGAEARLAGLAVDQRVGEAGDVAGGLPDAGVHQDGGVEALDVVALAHHRIPPALLDVVLQLDAERAVVPDGAGASVDLGGLEDEAPALGEADEGVEDVGAGRGGHTGKLTRTMSGWDSNDGRPPSGAVQPPTAPASRSNTRSRPASASSAGSA